MPRESLGDVEHFILVALLHLEGESYVVPVIKEIERRTGREVARPAVYIALKRLAAKGLVTSRVGDSTPVRGGRAKRYFKLTPAGLRQVREARDAFVRMWAGAERIAHPTAR